MVFYADLNPTIAVATVTFLLLILSASLANRAYFSMCHIGSPNHAILYNEHLAVLYLGPLPLVHLRYWPQIANATSVHLTRLEIAQVVANVKTRPTFHKPPIIQ